MSLAPYAAVEKIGGALSSLPIIMGATAEVGTTANHADSCITLVCNLMVAKETSSPPVQGESNVHLIEEETITYFSRLHEVILFVIVMPFKLLFVGEYLFEQ